MALYVRMPITCSTRCLIENTHLKTSSLCLPTLPFASKRRGFSIPSSCKRSFFTSRDFMPHIDTSMKASKAFDLVLGNNYKDDSDTDTDADAGSDGVDDHENPLLSEQMTREEMRGKLQEMLEQLDHASRVDSGNDEENKKEKMDNLLKDYSLVVDEEDPEWGEEYDEGWGFNLSDFFNKIEIKNDKNDDDNDDEGYDSAEDIVWQDDNYIKPIKEITTKEWEETVFVDFNPLIILVHNRYRRPRENAKARNELVKAIEIIWQSGVPSPRCVGIDACLEPKLVEALKVTTYPEIIFTKSGKILHRDKVVRTARQWSQIMGFFYYKAIRPSCLDKSAGQNQEKLPSISEEMV